MKPVSTIVVALFAVIATFHLLRLFTGWEVVVAGLTIPVWVSWPGIAIAGGLAILLWRESRA